MTTKDQIRSLFLDLGATAVGFAVAEKVPDEEWNLFLSWLDKSHEAGMDYMHNHSEIRRNPTLLMTGAKTIISLAFNYTPSHRRESSSGTIASYAYYPDYHKSLRRLLKNALRKLFGGNPDVRWRICIDSAPILERYWAVKAGIGFRGDNGMVIVPATGNRVFLAEILLNLPLEPDTPLDMDCGHCTGCRRACPGKALLSDGTVDCRRCISYLSIEHRGQWDKTGQDIMDTPQGKDTIFGCDRCLEVCPWNRVQDCASSPLSPLPEVLSLTKESLTEMDEAGFRSRLGATPLFRAGYDGIRRNIINTYTT